MVKKIREFLIEEVSTRNWIIIFGIWLALVIFWNYGYSIATPFQDVLVAVALSLAATLAHEKFSKVR